MNWLRQLFSRRRRYGELSESIREHLDEKIADLIDRGMAREEAEHAARREFGNVTRIEERSREVWQWPTLEGVWADITFALRQFRRAPAFTIVCILTLALGIGTNTAVYSVIQAVLLRPLPYHDSDRLMLLTDRQDPQDGGILYKDFEAWQQRNHSFTGIATYYRDSGWSQVTVIAGQVPQSIQGGFVTENFFPVLGVAPLLGRTFAPSEVDHHTHVIVLSYGLWRIRFGGSPDVIGQTLRIDGQLSQVIGVMPETFQFPSPDVQFWAPITTNRYWDDPALNSEDVGRSRGFYARWQAIGRLKNGITPLLAQSDIDAIYRRLQETDPDRYRGIGITV
ncbi:MAG: ABC transporter permease, partial [Acidobacteriaceae bacterium]